MKVSHRMDWYENNALRQEIELRSSYLYQGRMILLIIIIHIFLEQTLNLYMHVISIRDYLHF